MSEGPIVAARRKVAYEVARAIVDELECETELDTRELKRWENKIEARLLSRSEYLAPLLDAYEQQLATVTRERDEARAKIERYTKSLANVTAQEAWFIAACKRCQGTGIGTEEARAAGDNWSAAWDARAAAWEERDAAIKALCAEVSR